jgi:hypothetical protein
VFQLNQAVRIVEHPVLGSPDRTFRIDNVHGFKAILADGGYRVEVETRFLRLVAA